MDQAFFLRAQRLLEERRPARLDHGALLAAVTARQGACPTARAAAAPPSAAPGATEAEALVSLLLARPAKGSAAPAAPNCFNRAVAARAVNRP